MGVLYPPDRRRAEGTFPGSIVVVIVVVRRFLLGVGGVFLVRPFERLLEPGDHAGVLQGDDAEDAGQQRQQAEARADERPGEESRVDMWLAPKQTSPPHTIDRMPRQM
jgi:hypothetical protein